MNKMICKLCGSPRKKGRRLCVECDKERKRKQSKDRYERMGHYKYQHICIICKTPFETTHKDSDLCPKCLETLREYKSGDKYAYSKHAGGRLIWQHRVIAEQVMGRRLSRNEIVHHIDGDGTNNNLDNLLLMSRSDHSKLHHYLRRQRVFWKQSEKSGSRECWDVFMITQTMVWIKTTGAQVIQLSQKAGMTELEDVPDLGSGVLSGV